jgi:carboxypeptidase T
MKRRSWAVRSVILLSVSLAALAAQGAFAKSETTSLVRYFLDSEMDRNFLISHPELDIVHFKPGVHVDIVADPEQLDLLRSSGARLEIIHEDLTAFFLSRIDPAKSDSFGAYHNWTEAVAFMDSLRLLYPQVVSQKWSLGQGHEGRDLWCFRISDNPDLDESEPEVLFDGTHHAREPMSAEFCLLFAEYLAQNYGSDPQVTYLLDNREVYFVPIVNPDGYDYNNWGEMWRKNRRDNPGTSCDGVDINRNYTYQWTAGGSSTDPCADDYRGPSAGSEPETQAMMALINAHEFVTHNTYHTYSNLTLYPWGYATSPTPDDAIFTTMGEIMTRYNGYVPGQPGDVLWYTVAGGMIDWAYGAQTEHAKIFSFSNEIGNGADYFWPPESRRLPLFQENIWPAIYLMRAAAAFVSAGEPVVLGDDGNGRLDPGETAQLSLTLTNEGVAAAAQNVAVTLACDDPYLQLATSGQFVGSMAAMATTDFSASPFPVTLAGACPNGRLITITATVAHAGGSLDFDLPLLVGAPVAIFSDDFEGGVGAWDRTGAWDATTFTSHSPTHSLTDSPAGNYPNSSSTSATLSSSYRAVSLSFWHRYDTEASYDYGFVQASADGAFWRTLAAYDGLQTSWQQVDLSLGDLIGQDIKIRFQLTSDTYITEDGWYIDDVTLYGSPAPGATPPPPVLLAPGPGATVGSQPILTVANSNDPDGPGPVTYGFRVYSDAGLTNLAATVDGVAEGNSQTQWTTPTLATGTYYWRAYAADPTAYGLLGEVRQFVVDDLSGVGALVRTPGLRVLGPIASGSVRLRVDLSATQEVSLAIYDARGAVVRRLRVDDAAGGSQIVTWDGRDNFGRTAASGVYFARLKAGSQEAIDRIVIVR